VGHERSRGLLLDRRERSLEAEVERRPFRTLVLDVQADAVAAQQFLECELGPAIRGSATCCGRSCAQLITRGVIAVDRRMLCFL